MIYLISIKTLKDEYMIDDNMSDKYLLSNIQKGQRFIINAILGDDKYNEIIGQVDSGTTTSQNNTIIQEFIQPILAYYVMSESIYTTAYKFKNIGVEDNANKFDELVKISKKYLKDCETYQQLLKDYINNNDIELTCSGRKNVIKTNFFIDRNEEIDIKKWKDANNKYGFL